MPIGTNNWDVETYRNKLENTFTSLGLSNLKFGYSEKATKYERKIHLKFNATNKPTQ